MHTKEQIEVLLAVYRSQKGSWEMVDKANAASCIEAGLLQQSGSGYQLTGAGRKLIEKELISAD